MLKLKRLPQKYLDKRCHFSANRLVSLVSYRCIENRCNAPRRYTAKSGMYAGRSTIPPAKESRKSHMFTDRTR